MNAAFACTGAICALVAVIACGDPPGAAPGVVVEEVDGVRIVRVPPIGEMELPEIPVHRAFSASEWPDRHVVLYQVRAGLFLGDSLLAVANSGSSEVVLLGSGGRLARRVGGPGAGPGEFLRGPTALLRTEEGGFAAYDQALSFFDGRGTFLRREPLEVLSRTATLAPLALFRGGGVMAVMRESAFGFAPERRDTFPLVHIGPDGASRDTLGTWPGSEKSIVELGTNRLLVPIGFAHTAYADGNGRRIVIGATDSLDLQVLDVSGRPLLEIVASPLRRKPSKRDVEAWRDRLMERLPIDDEQVARAWKSGPVRDVLPEFEGVGVDILDRIWVGEYVPRGEPKRRWVIFSATGEPLGQVHLPTSEPEILPGSTELLALGAHRVALLLKNRVGEERVEIWSLAESDPT